MPVIEVTEDWSGDVTDESFADESSLLIQDESTRVFDVIFDSAANSSNAKSAAAEALGLPAMYEEYPDDAWRYVASRRSRRTGPLRCQVTVNYDSEPDPLSQYPEYSWDFGSSSEPIDHDYSGNPILNSAGESFDPPIMTDVYDLTLRYRRNEASYSAPVAEAYIGAVNTAAFLGFAAGKVKCTKFAGTQARAAALTYWVVDYEFIVRVSDFWKRKILDEGFRVYIGTDAAGKPDYDIMKDTKGNPLSQPVLLDGNGEKLNDGANAVFLEFDIMKTANLTALSILV